MNALILFAILIVCVIGIACALHELRHGNGGPDDPAGGACA